MLSLHDLKDRAELVWAWSWSERKTKAFTAKHGVPATTDIDKIVDDPRVEAVLLLTPPERASRTRRAVLRAAEACARWRSRSRSRSTAPSGWSRRAQIRQRLASCCSTASGPAACACARSSQSGALGKVEAATMLVPWWRPQSYYDEPGRGTMARDGGGVLLTQAIHTLDLFRSLVGVRVSTPRR